MNKITIILKESGTIAELNKNFNIYQNSSQNVLLDILVPKSMIEGKFSAQYTNENGQIVESGVYTAVKIGIVYIDNYGKYGKSETYYVRYLKDIKTSEGEFYVYERIMPSVFTRVAGVGTFAPKMVINVMNILNSQIESTDGTISENPTILTLITTQECKIDIEPSTNLDVEPEVDATELELIEGQVNELTAEIANKVDGDYIVQKYDLEEAIPDNIHYEKDGFKTKGVRFYNETYIVPIDNISTVTKAGEVYVSNVRPHETELYWILQDEVFHYDTGIAMRTLVINAVQASINQYTTMSVGQWRIVNQDYIDEIKGQADQNSDDIEVLYRLANTGTNYLGEYPSQDTLPSDSELNEYVQDKVSRQPQNGDEVTFVLIVEDGTDIVYIVKYSEVTSSWTATPMPTIEPAQNNSLGLLKGSVEEDITESKKVLVDVNNGQIYDILHLNEDSAKESISTHLNRNSQATKNNTTAIANLDDDLQSEIQRATQAEQTNATAIASEIERATQSENAIENDLLQEIARAQTAEQTNATAIENETTRASQVENDLDTDKLDKENVNTNYLKNIVFSINGDNGVASLELNNPVTGQTQNIEITVTSPASSTNTGLMTSSMVQALSKAIDDIETLKYIGKQIASFQSYAEAELFDFSTISSININDYFIVQEDESRTEPTEKDKTTRYVCIDDTSPITIDSFQFSEVITTVNIQVATEFNLGGVLSTNTNGYVYVEANGSMKLVGYDAILSSINNLTSALSNETERAESAENTLSQAITAETQRAKQAEQTNASSIANEITRAQQAESNLQLNKADRSELPTKTSNLTNDSGFITQSAIPTTTSAFTNNGDGTQVNGTVDPYAKVSQIPTNNSQLTNGADYATNSEVNTAVNTKTAVNVGNQFQSTLDFDSDPQSQLDDLKNIFITLTENSGTLTQEQFNILNNNPNSYIVYANRTYYRQFAGNPYQFICINMLNNLMTQYVYGFYTLTINDNDLSYSTDSQLLVSTEGLNGFVYLLDTQSNQTITGEKNFTNLKLNNNTPLGIVDSGSIGSSETDFYIRLDNNIQICFGYRNRVGNNTLITVQPYRDAEYSVQVTQRGVNSSWSDNMKARNLTTTSFNVNTGGDTGYCWLCIGYWQ